MWGLATLRIELPELGARMGISHQRAWFILRNRTITEETLEELSAALGWDVARWRKKLRVPRSPAAMARKLLAAEAERRLGVKKNEQQETSVLHWLKK